MNKLLQRQLQKHFGKEEQVPETFTRLLNVISDSYDHYEKDRKLIERSIELSSKEMIELNSQVKKNGKAELEKAHHQLKMLFENIEEVFYSVDVVKLKIVQISAACEKVYGYSPAEFLDDRNLWYKIILPEDIRLVDQHFKELYEGKMAISQYRILHKDKRIRWLESKVIPVLDEDGQLIRMEGVTNDITERKNAEATILKAYEDKNTVLERIDDGFYAVDKNSIVTYWNKKAEILLGAKKEDVIGKNLHEIFAGTTANVFYNHYQKAIRENRTIHFEEFSIRTKKWFAVSAFASENGLSIFFKDVTERKESEASLDLMNKELEFKNKELEHFAYIASHDLQEPLRTTSSFVDLLQQQYKGRLDEKADKYLHYITDSTDRMKILITDLLDYSRIGNKKELQQIDCNALLNELLQDLDTTLQETGAVINIEPLPVISGFKTEVIQLFQNLVVNAIKFRKKDTTPKISISAQKDKSNWTFAIRDNGIGMAEVNTDRIFVIFQRLHTRTEYEGSGIGLAHCKKIVGLHGGDIWVESKPGEGATFYFTIPLNQ